MFAQIPVYNNCNYAEYICPDKSMTFTNVKANASTCSNCEDDFTFCFTPNNTIWLKFETNSTGGTIQINFSNLIFESSSGQSQQLQASIIQATTPCDASTYTQIGNCISNATTNFSLTSPALLPNTIYYVVVGGDETGVGITKAAECTFNVFLTGGAVSKPAPFMSILPSSTNVCANDIVTFSVTLINCPDSTNFRWFVNGTLVALTSESFYQTSSLKDGDIVSVQTSCYTICVDTISKNSLPIHVTTVEVDAGIDISKGPNESKLVEASTSAPEHYWTPDLYLSDSSGLFTRTFTPITMSYTLTAVENGCKAHDEMTVFVNSEVVIPNTFSPNDDGKNDKFEILYIENYPYNIVQIMDRWGQIIYETSSYDYEKAWDGKRNDDEMVEGVYFYHIELRDHDKRVYNGSVTILK